MRCIAGKHPLLPGLPVPKATTPMAWEVLCKHGRNAGMFPGGAEASTGDTRGDSVRMLTACRSSVSPERGRCCV